MNIRKLFIDIATGYHLRSLPFAHVLISLLGLPISFALKIFNARPLIEVACVGVVAAVCWGIIHIALRSIPPEIPRPRIFVDYILGIVVTLLFIPFRLKLLLFGFVLFHGGIYLLHFLQRNGFVKRLSGLPLSVEIIADDIAIGVVANIFMHLMIWIVL